MPSFQPVPKSLAEFAAHGGKERQNRFLPGRTPGWPLLLLRSNSPSVPGRKHFSGSKCTPFALQRERRARRRLQKTVKEPQRGF